MATVEVKLLNLHRHTEVLLCTAAEIEKFVYGAEINSVYQNP